MWDGGAAMTTDAMSTDAMSRTPWPAPWGRWFRACTLAEFLGIAAAAGMAGLAMVLVGEPSNPTEAALILAMSVAGGVVEGLAVGLLQWRVFRSWLPSLSRARYVGGTVVLAACFWLLGMLPSTLLALAPAEAGTTADDPPVLAVAVVSAVGGAIGGVAFGLVQGWALRGHVAHPWRWIRPNAFGWGVAVAVITVGASSAPAGIPAVGLVCYGAGIGLVAGACVGAVTAQAVPSLTLDLPWWNRVVVDLLLSPFHRTMSGSVVVLRFVGRRSGRAITLPVEYARSGGLVTVCAAHAARKQWWRSFADGPRPVHIVVRGERLVGTGSLVTTATPEHDAAVAAYRARWPRMSLEEDAVLVEVDLSSG
jgi:hypothetical protein